MCFHEGQARGGGIDSLGRVVYHVLLRGIDVGSIMHTNNEPQLISSKSPPKWHELPCYYGKETQFVKLLSL